MNSLCLCLEKEADNGEKIFDNFINSKIQKKWFKEIVLQQKQFSRSNNRKN